MTTSSRPPYSKHAGTTERSDIDALIGGVADGSEPDPFPVTGIDHVAFALGNAGTGFMICDFVPRQVDYHPLAIPVPYYHSNVDSDEVMFYCGGDYETRKGSGIGQGSISLHPGGHSHGPQPGSIERSLGAQFFDELAVMVDTFHPLELAEGAFSCEDRAYPWSWSGRGPDR